MKKNLNTQEVTPSKRVDKKAPPPRVVKTFKGEWYTLRSVLGATWAKIIYLLGGRIYESAARAIVVWNTFSKERSKKVIY